MQGSTVVNRLEYDALGNIKNQQGIGEPQVEMLWRGWMRRGQWSFTEIGGIYQEFFLIKEERNHLPVFTTENPFSGQGHPSTSERCWWEVSNQGEYSRRCCRFDDGDIVCTPVSKEFKWSKPHWRIKVDGELGTWYQVS